MVGKQALLDVLNDLEELRQQLAALTRDQPDGWKNSYFALRRTGVPLLTNLQNLANTWLAEQGDTLEAKQFRELTAAMRRALADHQASFPVSSIAPDDPLFRASSQRVDAARANVHSFVKARMKT